MEKVMIDHHVNCLCPACVEEQAEYTKPIKGQQKSYGDAVYGIPALLFEESTPGRPYKQCPECVFVSAANMGPSRIPVHNECPVCGRHLPDNVGACHECKKRATRATRQFFMNLNEENQDYPVSEAIDIIHDGRRDAFLRYWPES